MFGLFLMNKEEQNLFEISDKELIDNFLNGDEVAFERLVQRYSTYVVCIAYNILKDIHHANDIAQEVFVKLYNNLKHLKDRAKFKSWLYRVVRSTCLDALRKVHLKTSSIYQIPDETIDLEDSSTREPIGSFESDELKEKILNIIAMLPSIYQQIIILKHLRDMSYSEISEFLGIPAATVESRLYRARLLLKEKLEDLYWEGT
ncbi:MAG: RNA polymerase sigma factor [Planctomycetes bacterium]|nr:RNA polymerase sigma factor [Planctomycetota bacterium]